jgi:glutamate formiminotransferase
MKRVVPYIEMEEFHPDKVAKVSKACKSICQWVRAMYVYHNVALQVEPKRQALAQARSTEWHANMLRQHRLACSQSSERQYPTRTVL